MSRGKPDVEAFENQIRVMIHAVDLTTVMMSELVDNNKISADDFWISVTKTLEILKSKADRAGGVKNLPLYERVHLVLIDSAVRRLTRHYIEENDLESFVVKAGETATTLQNKLKEAVEKEQAIREKQ